MTILILIDCKSLLCKRYSGKTLVLKVQASPPLLLSEVEQIRLDPLSLEPPTEVA